MLLIPLVWIIYTTAQDVQMQCILVVGLWVESSHLPSDRWQLAFYVTPQQSNKKWDSKVEADIDLIKNIFASHS